MFAWILVAILFVALFGTCHALCCDYFHLNASWEERCNDTISLLYEHLNDAENRAQRAEDEAFVLGQELSKAQTRIAELERKL